MSFDIIMDGKKLKYVINSELQATNISIDDHISNDKLMEAILSTRAATMEQTTQGKAKAQNLFSDSSALDIQKSFINKMVDTYRNIELEKRIAFKKIKIKFDKSQEFITKFKADLSQFSEDELKKYEPYMNIEVQHLELDIQGYKAFHEHQIANDKLQKAEDLLETLNTSSSSQDKLNSDFAALDKNYSKHDITLERIQQLDDALDEAKRLLTIAKKQTPAEIQTLERQSQQRNERVAAVLTSTARTHDAKKLSEAGVKIAKMIYDDKYKKTTFGLRFGGIDTAIFTNFELGKITGIVSNELPSGLPESKWNAIKVNDILVKIEEIGTGTSENTTIWLSDATIDNTKAQLMYSKLKDKKMDALYNVLGKDYNDAYERATTDERKKRLDNLIKFMHLVDTLHSKLKANKQYTFYFREPDPNDPLERAAKTPEELDGERSIYNMSTQEGRNARENLTKRVKGFFGRGGKNKTKKVNRKRSN
jgi:hypothetical protein